MKKLLKDAVCGISKGLRAMLPTMLLVLGAAAVSGGVAMIYLPAGVISVGALAIVSGVLMIRGGDDESE